MTHALWLRIDDSITQVALSNASLGYNLLGYAPESGADGQETVTEQVRLYVTGSTATQLQSRLQEMDRFLEIARRRKERKVGSKIYIELQMSGEASIYRSEVIDGRLLYDEGALRYWANTSAEVTLIIERRAWWESKTLTEIPLKNGSIGSKATGGVTIFNHDDGDANHDNWVDIVAADVVGAVPSPLYLSMLNASGSALNVDRVYVSNNVFGGPSDVDILEGEDSTGPGSDTANASHSNGFIRSYSWVGGPQTHATKAYIWPLTQLSNMYGHWFNALARATVTTDTPTPMYAQLRVQIPSNTTLWTGPEIELEAGRLLHSLGTVPLPPLEMRPVPQMEMVLSVRCFIGGSFNVDFLQLSGPDGFHHFRHVGYELPTTSYIVVDGPEEQTYMLNAAATEKWPVYAEYSPRVNVWPGQNQRIRVLFDEDGSTYALPSAMNIARTLTVRAYYRPRRLTL